MATKEKHKVHKVKCLIVQRVYFFNTKQDKYNEQIAILLCFLAPYVTICVDLFLVTFVKPLCSLWLDKQKCIISTL